MKQNPVDELNEERNSLRRMFLILIVIAVIGIACLLILGYWLLGRS